MKLLLLVGQEEQFLSAATQAARLAFPEAAVKRCTGVNDAGAMPESSGPELLVVIGGSEAEIVKATQLLDSGGLPRWAVVVAGKEAISPDVEHAPPEDWEPARLTRIFKSALARQRLVRANAQLRGDVLSIGTRIAHDLRSPLGGVFAACDSLNEALAVDAPGCVPLTQPILDSAHDVMKTVQQLSQVTKATASRPERLPYNMGTPVLTALERHGRLAAEKQATFSEPETWPEMMGDIAWAESIWWNLIDNALRHSGARPRIELGWRPGRGEILFWVNDQGEGVPPQKRRALFQSFHLLHEPNAPRGLGLPMVHRLVRLQGGRCGYEPGSPMGSSFFFSIPIE